MSEIEDLERRVAALEARHQKLTATLSVYEQREEALLSTLSYIRGYLDSAESRGVSLRDELECLMRLVEATTGSVVALGHIVKLAFEDLN